MFERLVYENSSGMKIEMQPGGRYHCNIRKDVSGLTSITQSVYTTQVMDTDGAVETGAHIEARNITITGVIKSPDHVVQDDYIAELIDVFNPFLSGTLIYEGANTRQIAVRVEKVYDIIAKPGQRWPTFAIDLVAPDPNWTETGSKTISVLNTGTTAFYKGTKACGIIATITALANGVDIESIGITNNSLTETITFSAGAASLDANDVVVLDTRPGHIGVTLNGVNALARLDLDNTVFAKLYRGINVITWSAYGDEASITVSVEYQPQYLTGVS